MEQNKLILPLSIIIAGALIGGALYFGNRNSGPTANQNQENPPAISGEMKPVSRTEDHILGNPDAPIKLVEYSDTNCPFCRAFHPTMKRIVNEYGENGQVAWIYRHFSILGPQSITEAEATECAAELGGNEKFWQYLDLLFDSKGERARLPADITLDGLAEEIGLNVEQFNACLSSGKYTERITSSRDDAVSAGAKGTPFTVLVTEKSMVPINGAQPYENVKDFIEQALRSL